jgi:hypothetical protein
VAGIQLAGVHESKEAGIAVDDRSRNLAGQNAGEDGFHGDMRSGKARG